MVIIYNHHLEWYLYCGSNHSQIVLAMQPDQFVAASTDYKQRLTWVAIYNTGQVIIQRDEAGDKSSEILDHSKLYIFHLVDKDKPLYTLRLKEGQKFFYRSRTAMRAGVGVLDRIHIVGWRDDNQNKCVCFISESDMHVEVGDFVYENDPYKKIRPWIYEIQWREIDEQPIAETVVEIGDTEQVYRYIQK